MTSSFSLSRIAFRASSSESFSGKIRVENRVPGDFRKGSKFVVMLRAADE